MSQEVRVVITGDSTQAERALERVDSLLGELGNVTRQPIGNQQGFGRLNKDIKGVGDQSRYAREQMRNLSYQMTDIVTGLATGQNPFFVLLQQGGQLRDVFGGIVPALRAVASIFTITRVAAGGAAAAVLAFAVAAVKGAQESEALTDALAATGNAAQVTAGQFEIQVREISSSTRVAIGSVREYGMAFVEAGQLSAQAFAPAVTAAAVFAKATGKSADDVQKEFAGLTQDTAKWALDFARRYRAVDAAALEHIRTLQAQGRQQEAIKVASDAVAASFEGRIVPSQFAVVRGWNALTKALGEYWDRLKSVGRDETPEGRLQDLLQKQQEREAARSKGLTPDAGLFRGEERDRAQIRALQNLVGASRRTRDLLADDQQKDAKEREDATAEGYAALAGIDQAGIQKRLALQEQGLARAREIYDAAFQRDEVEARGYQQALLEIDMQTLDARQAALRAQAALESRRPVSTVNETRAQQAALLLIETELLRIEGERAKLRAAEASGERDITPKARSVGPRDDLRRFENAERAAEAAISESRRANALQTANDLVAINRQLSVELLRDDQARAVAQLALEERAMRERLDLAALSEEGRKQALEDFAEWRVLRERQLNEQIKPLWQQQVEDWRDVNLLMRQASAETWNGVLQNAEDAFVQLLTTGRLSLTQLVQDFAAAQARLEFRKFIGGLSSGNLTLPFQSLFSSAATAVGSFLGIGGGRAYGGDVYANRLHPINERGVPEVLSIKGKDYLATGATSGKVTPMKSSGRSINAVVNQTNYIDSRTDSAQVAQIAANAAEGAQQRLLEELTAQRVI